MTTNTPTTALADMPQYSAPDLSRHAMDDAEKATYKDGHRAGWRAAETELRARRAAQPVAPVQLSRPAEIKIANGPTLRYEARTTGEPGWLMYNSNGNLIRAMSLSEVELIEAALGATPSPQIAEVAELPPLPWSDPELVKRFGPPLYTAEQYRQGQRDAIAASRRAARSEAIEQWRLEGTTAWYDVSADDKNATLGTHTSYEKRTVYATPAPASAGQAAPVVVEPRKMSWTDSPFKTDYYQAQAWAQGWNECIAAQPAEGAGQAGQVASDYTDPTIACCDCGLTMGESTLLGHIALGKLKVISGRAAAPADPQDLLDAARYRWLRHADLDALAAGNWGTGQVYEGVKFDDAIDRAMAATHQPSAQKGGA